MRKVTEVCVPLPVEIIAYRRHDGPRLDVCVAGRKFSTVSLTTLYGIFWPGVASCPLVPLFATHDFVKAEAFRKILRRLWPDWKEKTETLKRYLKVTGGSGTPDDPATGEWE